MPRNQRDFALMMHLRPNPTLMLHSRLALRGVEHRDIFAYIHADQCYFVIEIRGGGRDPLLRKEVYLAHTYSMASPRIKTPSVLDSLPELQKIKVRPDALSRWLQRYHHRWMRALGTLPPTKGFFRLSVLFHYFHAYDLDPMKGFMNHYGNGQGKGSRSAGRHWKKPEITLDDII